MTSETYLTACARLCALVVEHGLRPEPPVINAVALSLVTRWPDGPAWSPCGATTPDAIQQDDAALARYYGDDGDRDAEARAWLTMVTRAVTGGR